MRLRLTLTILSDLDLLTLGNIPEFNFKGWVKNSLRTYVGSGITLKIPLPLTAPPSLTLKSVTYSITFDKNKDHAVENWLKSIKKKHRSGAIKSVLRCSLENPCLFAHYDVYPTTFLALSPEKGHIAAKEAGRNTLAPTRAVPVAVTQIPQPTPAQFPENKDEGGDDDFDIFSISMDIQK